MLLESVPPIITTVENDPIRRCTYIISLQAVAQAFGRSISYNHLKGFAATAFRLMFHQDWHRYGPDAMRGFDHTPLAFRAVGLNFTWIQAQEESRAAESSAAILTSLQAGRPVMAMRLMAWKDWGVIAGYDGDTLLCRTPHDDSSGNPSYNTHWPTDALIVTGQTTIPDPLILAQESLQAAVDLFETPCYGPYRSGRAAFLYWIAGLRDEAFYNGEIRGEYQDWIAALKRDEIGHLNEDLIYASPYLERAHVNCWRMFSLTDARREAEIYLKDIASWFVPAAADHLRQAGNCYGQETALLRQAIPLAPFEWDLDKIPWTQDQRSTQADLLERALALEEQAVSHIKTALVY